MSIPTGTCRSAASAQPQALRTADVGASDFGQQAPECQRDRYFLPEEGRKTPTLARAGAPSA
jgi:hypothetical protein